MLPRCVDIAAVAYWGAPVNFTTGFLPWGSGHFRVSGGSRPRHRGRAWLGAVVTAGGAFGLWAGGGGLSEVRLDSNRPLSLNLSRRIERSSPRMVPSVGTQLVRVVPFSGRRCHGTRALKPQGGVYRAALSSRKFASWGVPGRFLPEVNNSRQ